MCRGLNTGHCVYNEGPYTCVEGYILAIVFIIRGPAQV